MKGLIALLQFEWDVRFAQDQDRVPRWPTVKDD